MRHSILFLLILVTFPGWLYSSDSWQKVLRTKKGELTFYWYPNNVNVDDSKDVIDGVEHDLAFAFADYLIQKYQIDLKVNWLETNSFAEILDLVEDGPSGVFGASNISITQERQAKFQFTPAYLADISVLVTSPNVPIAHTQDEFEDIFMGLNAITIENTTLSSSIDKLKKELGVEFNTTYVDNSGAIIQSIASTDFSFGYLDLPNFLISIRNNIKIRRQFFYPVKLEGVAMIFPKESDWTLPVNDYFQSKQFKEDKKRIILRYFGDEISEVINQISRSAEIGPFEEIVISNRERELQYEELIEAANREKKNSEINNALIILLGFVCFGVFFLLISNKVKSQVNRVLMEQQSIIEERNAQLRKLNDEKNDLIKVLAHDLRTPLSNIQGCAMLMKENNGLDGDSRKMVEFINQSSTKIKDMIAKILDVDAIESGDRNIHLEMMPVQSVVNQVVQEQRTNAKKKQIKIGISEKRKEKVIADRFYLAQVIENLVSNAIKFSEKGSEILLSVKKHKNYVRIIVKDNGPGLSEEDKSKVFMKFQKLSTKPTDGEETTGLGLSIVKKYTEMMGGKVSFTSQQGEGTEFYVDLKLA